MTFIKRLLRKYFVEEPEPCEFYQTVITDPQQICRLAFNYDEDLYFKRVEQS